MDDWTAEQQAHSVQRLQTAGISVFSISDVGATKLQDTPMALEIEMQRLVERHSEVLLGVRFVATEYSTGRSGGRIDTLGLDENNAPVIIEYKRTIDQNIMSQGLSYLHWLDDRHAEFEREVARALDASTAKRVRWDNPRLICIAREFSKWDRPAAQAVSRDINLVKFKLFEPGVLVLELVHTSASHQRRSHGSTTSSGSATPGARQLDPRVIAWFKAIERACLALGQDVQKRPQDRYVAFARLRNFACVQQRHQAGKLLVYIRVDPSTIAAVRGFSRDMRGHSPIGNLEVTIDSDEDVPPALELIRQSYERA